MKYKIVPTLIGQNQKKLDSVVKHYKNHFRYFQLDVMDGKFVENKSNWFRFKLSRNFKYEAHLMVNSPESWIRKHYSKFEILIANFEKIKNPLKLIEFVKSKKKKIGFALNPETKVKDVIPYIKAIDLVLILAVHPGKYDAEFLPEVISKIKELRKLSDKDIEIDGHMDPETIKLCKDAGANVFAIGSYLKNSENLNKSINELKSILS